MNIMEVLDSFGKYKYDYGLTKDDIQFAIEKVERAKFFLDNQIINLPDGRPATLSQVVSNWYVNPHRYVSEIKHRIYSLHNYAVAKDLVPVFITMTLPTEYHRYKFITLKNGKEVKVKNNNFNSEFSDLTPRDLVQILNNNFKKMMNLRAFRDIDKNKRLYFKVIEPHKTGDPHLHAMLYIPKDNVCKFWSNFIYLCKEKLKIQYDIQINILNPVNYMIKYILKTIDDYRFENTKLFQYSPLALWYIRWGIRRFSMSRNFVRIDLYRRFNGKYTLNELTNLVKNGVIEYFRNLKNQITDIFLNDEIIGSINLWTKKDYFDYNPPFQMPKLREKSIPVYDENNKIIGYTNGCEYKEINSDFNIKPLSKMTRLELVQYENDLLNEFDNPFLDEEDLDILVDKYVIFNKYVDEDYNYQEVPNFWLRGEDLNLRPSGYEPDELPGCSTPRQLAGLGGFEPPNAGVKVQCLTAWRQPIIFG
ncbi:bacteriophage replication gene A protein [Lebetimonas natsushimae]|uniref:Bacteriophage replication gene A protein n=1 Tax=Lebetimonas natsushimae TaxID=1936991 RepID=A0A292YD68_9BACT|nr:bacteriophage replication gene A protein [Lebetimonas natsushimae]